MTGDHSCRATKKSCDTVACVVTQEMVVGTKARPGFELVNQVSGIKPDKLPTKPVFHSRNLLEFVNC
jgi:hypothetical protein